MGLEKDLIELFGELLRRLGILDGEGGAFDEEVIFLRDEVEDGFGLEPKEAVVNGGSGLGGGSSEEVVVDLALIVDENVFEKAAQTIEEVVESIGLGRGVITKDGFGLSLGEDFLESDTV